MGSTIHKGMDQYEFHMIKKLLKGMAKPIPVPVPIPEEEIRPIPEPPNLRETGPANKKFRFKEYLIRCDDN